MGSRRRLCRADFGGDGLTGETAPELFLRHVSPDGALTWIVNRYRDTDGAFDYAFGFETDDSPWHAHPDSLDPAGRTREQMVFDVTDGLLTDRYVIKTTRRHGRVAEHALLDSIEVEREHLIYPDDDTTLRFWSGRRVTLEELSNGSVRYLPFDS